MEFLMSRPQQSNIKKRLILGFCALISIFLLFGVYSLYDIHRISQLSRIIYNHPLVVSNAALQANTSIVKMHRSMKDVVLFHSLSRIQQSIEIVNDEEERVHRQLDIIKNNILGDEGKTLENEARKLFDAWRPIRNEVIGLIHNDQRENAANITIGKGADHVALLETKMLGLLNYAKSKASEFNIETERIVTISNVMGIFLLLLGILVSILVAFTTLKRTSLIEKKLIESENQYRRLFETANDAILLVEKSEGKIVRANPSVSAMFGYPEEECIERRMKDIGFPDEFDNIEEILQILSKKDIIHYKDIPLLKKDGQAFDTEIYMVNKASLLQCNVRDITEKKREEEALRESEERYRAFFEKGPDGVVVLEPETAQIIEFNDRACRQLGYSREEFALLRVFDIEVKETAEDTHARIRQVLDKGQDDFETLQRTKQGEIRQVHVTAQVIEVVGKVVYHCIWRDITERKQAEEMLRQSENKLRATIDATPFPVAVVDLKDDIIIFWSHSAITLFGHTAPTASEWYQIAYPDPDYRREVVERWKLYLEIARESRQTVNTGEYRVTCSDGSVRICELYATFLPDSLIVTFNDITERKQAVEKVRASGAHLRTLIRTIPDLVWLKDPEGIYLSCNPRFERFFGAKMNDIIGKTDYDFVDKEMADSFRENDKKAMAKGKPSINEEEVTFADDGHREILETIKTPMYRNNGQLAGVLGIGRNITERVSLQAQLVQAQKMESVGRLAGGVAHDYNNALSVIIGFTELTIDGVDPAGPLRANLEEVLAAANRAKDITRQLLAFARKQTIAPKVLDLNDNVEGMLKMLRHLIGEDIDLAWLPATNLWPVKMDPSQIDQILANLCVNARDAIGGVGKITIGTDTVVFDTEYCSDHVGFVPGGFVRLAVSDNGCGIDKEILNKIFEPFFTTKDVDKGTGLGLAMVYGIVKQNNGFINVYSEPGKGTTIKIYLPRYEAEVTEIHDESTLEIPPGRGETVLLVEDELSVLKLTQKILDNLGYTTLTAGTPGEALRLAEAHASEIHLLVTDVIMPEMNGRELAERLQSLYPGLKYMFMSGYTANAISHRNILDKGVNFIHKPFSKRDLATTVRNALDEERRLI
jgi:PAS domain S-box-containing protein